MGFLIFNNSHKIIKLYDENVKLNLKFTSDFLVFFDFSDSMAAATGCFKRILQVLEKWPVDETKVGRDLGQYLREKVNKAYKTNQFEADIKYWDQQYLSLEKLVKNEYSKKFPRLLNSSATGLTREQCQIALSNEFLEENSKENQSIFKRLFPSIS